jgi:hypothetical protein
VIDFVWAASNKINHVFPEISGLYLRSGANVRNLYGGFCPSPPLNPKKVYRPGALAERLIICSLAALKNGSARLAALQPSFCRWTGNKKPK